jgi:hypothetical protein
MSSTELEQPEQAGSADDLIRARLSNTFDPRCPEGLRAHPVGSKSDSGDRGKEFLITSRKSEVSRLRPRR